MNTEKCSAICFKIYLLFKTQIIMFKDIKFIKENILMIIYNNLSIVNSFNKCDNDN